MTKAHMGDSGTPAPASITCLASWPSSTGLQKQGLRCSGCCHDLWKALRALIQAPTLPTARNLPSTVLLDRQKGERGCILGSFQQTAKLRSEKKSIPQDPLLFSCLPTPPSLNVMGRIILGSTRFLPLPFTKQTECLVGAPHAPSQIHLAFVGFHPMTRGEAGDLDTLLGNSQVLAKLKIPKICALPFSAARPGEREGSKQLSLPNMGLTASNEATVEACRHPAGRFKGMGSLQGLGQDPAGNRQKIGQAFPLVWLVGSAATRWGPSLRRLEPVPPCMETRGLWLAVCPGGNCFGDLPGFGVVMGSVAPSRPHPKPRNRTQTPLPFAFPHVLAGWGGMPGEKLRLACPKSRPTVHRWLATARLVQLGSQGPPRWGCWPGLGQSGLQAWAWQGKGRAGDNVAADNVARDNVAAPARAAPEPPAGVSARVAPAPGAIWARPKA